jgi:ribosomal protein S27AE
LEEMMKLTTNIKKHVPLPKETPAFYCGNCGVVSLDQNNICNPKGSMKKIDWCGSEDLPQAKFCKNRVNNERYKCGKCGKAAINSALLCEPEKMPMP